MNRFDNTVAIVTGAGSGIGEATAKRLSDEGATVVLVGRTKEKLDKVAAALPAERVRVKPGDVSDEQAITKIISSTAAEFGRLDILVNNAGVAVGGKVTEVSTEDWRQVMSINAAGIFFACRAALPQLAKTGGCVVNTASVSGIGGDWGMSVYNASKGAVVNLTRAMALDHAKDGVHVNAVAPSLTRTEMTAGMSDNHELMAKFKQRIPFGRPAEAEEVAAAIAFLASHDARFVTGVILPVDGGLSASNGQPALAD